MPRLIMDCPASHRRQRSASTVLRDAMMPWESWWNDATKTWWMRKGEMTGWIIWCLQAITGLHVRDLQDCPAIDSAWTGVKSAPWRKTLQRCHQAARRFKVRPSWNSSVYMCLWLFLCIWHAHSVNLRHVKVVLGASGSPWRFKQHIWDALSAH